MEEMLYIHLDNTCNAVLSKGIFHDDFDYSVTRRPQNILFLTPDVPEGEFERHTGLKIIQGETLVSEYFKTLRKRRNSPIKWIDFADIELIQQLSPNEISELLYFGHMKTQLHSPFFYKLQNNFAYFGMSPEVAKVYYRHMSDFYQILGDKIRRNILERLNERKGFFKRATPVDSIPNELLSQLKVYIQEGVVLKFPENMTEGKQYTIPIYLAEDRYRTMESTQYKKEQLLATIVYIPSQRQWLLEKKENLEEWPFRHPIYEH